MHIDGAAAACEVPAPHSLQDDIAGEDSSGVAGEEEEQIVTATTAIQDATVSEVYSRDQMIAFQELARRMPVSRHVVSYAVAIARSTRPGGGTAGDYVKQYVEWGAGPRASQYMVLGGKALAVLDGVPAVSAAHVRQVAPFVLRHRVLPNYNATGEGITARVGSARETAGDARQGIVEKAQTVRGAGKKARADKAGETTREARQNRAGAARARLSKARNVFRRDKAKVEKGVA